jgi:hypothetical protein
VHTLLTWEVYFSTFEKYIFRLLKFMLC